MIAPKEAPHELIQALRTAEASVLDARRQIERAVLPVPIGTVVIHESKRTLPTRYIVRGCELYAGGRFRLLRCQRIKKNGELGGGRALYFYDLENCTVEAEGTGETGGGK